jgi:hypothetical protein
MPNPIPQLQAKTREPTAYFSTSPNRRPARHHRSTLGLQGAEAILTLRAVISNGDFDEYWRFHLTREHQRLYPGTTQGQYTLGA